MSLGGEHQSGEAKGAVWDFPLSVCVKGSTRNPQVEGHSPVRTCRPAHAHETASGQPVGMKRYHLWCKVGIRPSHRYQQVRFDASPLGRDEG